MKAVLTGDIIDSRGYDAQELKKLLASLQTAFKQIPQSRFEMYRGDSFQGLLDRPEKALQAVIHLKTVIGKMNIQHSKDIPDMRIAIGIGKVLDTKGSLSVSNGLAFEYSGITLDAMKGSQFKTAFTSGHHQLNLEFKASLSLFDAVTTKWTQASAEVVYFLNQGLKEHEIASQLSISQQAVNARKKVAQWDAIQLLLQRFEQVVKDYSYGKS